MKLFLDQNLSRRMAPMLQERFPGTVSAALLNMKRSSDQEIWEYARENGFVIVTRDSDFQDMSVVLGSPPPVIRLLMRNPSWRYVGGRLLEIESSILESLESGEIAYLEVSD
ncbi:MAG: DUF5615 family PIN-like protein [Magnetococcales bacterium]|nr:DUF5615 family PIN-like protein [Magnetococcales bacterium]